MSTTTPKSGINYAKLRKQRSKDEPIPKHGILKHRSTSQHNIQQIQLFDQYFNQTRTYEYSDNFLDFLDRQINYHQSIQQVRIPQYTKPQSHIFKTQQKKWESDKQKLLETLQQYKQENNYFQKELTEMKKTRVQLMKRCELLQELIVKERLGQRPVSNYQTLLKNIQIPVETVSSLADERFESNETSLDSSLSDDDQMSPSQLMDMIRKQRGHFQKQSI